MGLSPLTLKGIRRKGYQLPTPIQRKAIPLMLEGQDLVGMARTGSGKTAAFVVPILERCGTWLPAALLSLSAATASKLCMPGRCHLTGMAPVQRVS